MHHTLATAAKRADSALAGIFIPSVLVPLMIALGVLWYLVPGSYRLVGESEAQLIEQAQGVCAEKGGDYKRLPGATFPRDVGVAAELFFSCE